MSQMDPRLLMRPVLDGISCFRYSVAVLDSVLAKISLACLGLLTVTHFPSLRFHVRFVRNNKLAESKAFNPFIEGPVFMQ